MAYIDKIGVDNTVSLERELSALSPEARTQVSRYIKKIIQASTFEYHESEALKVKKVKLDKLSNRGHIEGEFVNSKKYIEDIKPRWPNITTVPVEGEHVAVIQYGIDYFYTSIINRTGGINNNIVDGQKLENFETRKVNPIKLNEGSIVYEGRTGQSFHFDNNITKKKNEKSTISPVIKIRAEHDSSGGGLLSEDLDADDASIYLTSNGLENQRYNGNTITGKNIFMQSDNIYIKGRKDVVIEGNGEVFINAKSGQTIKMGDPKSVYIPTVNGKEIAEFLKNLVGFITKTMGAIGKATNPATILQAAKDVKAAIGDDLPAIIDTVKNETILNKTIMTADPNFKLPETPASKFIAQKVKRAKELKKNVEKRVKQAEKVKSETQNKIQNAQSRLEKLKR